MAENQFKFASTDEMVVDQLKLNAENKKKTNWIQAWMYKLEEYEHEDLDKRLQMFYAEV